MLLWTHLAFNEVEHSVWQDHVWELSIQHIQLRHFSRISSGWVIYQMTIEWCCAIYWNPHSWISEYQISTSFNWNFLDTYFTFIFAVSRRIKEFSISNDKYCLNVEFSLRPKSFRFSVRRSSLFALFEVLHPLVYFCVLFPR